MHSSIARRLTGADSDNYWQHNTLATTDTVLSEFSLLLRIDSMAAIDKRRFCDIDSLANSY